jgi:hypothetical protein
MAGIHERPGSYIGYTNKSLNVGTLAKGAYQGAGTARRCAIDH